MASSLAILMLLVSLELVSIFCVGSMPPQLERQTDFAGRWNVAAVFMASIGSAAGVGALFRGTFYAGNERRIWILLGAGCIGFSLADLALDVQAERWIIPLLGVWGGVFFLLLHRQVQGQSRASMLLALALFLVVLNPVFDRYEIRIAGTPENYQFIRLGEPYQMDVLSWKKLTLIRQGQEVTELVVMLVILYLVLSIDGIKMSKGVPALAVDEPERGQREDAGS